MSVFKASVEIISLLFECVTCIVCLEGYIKLGVVSTGHLVMSTVDKRDERQNRNTLHAEGENGRE